MDIVAFDNKTNKPDRYTILINGTVFVSCEDGILISNNTKPIKKELQINILELPLKIRMSIGRALTAYKA